MKSLPFHSVVTAALLALAVSLPSKVSADGGSRDKKPDAAGGDRDAKKAPKHSEKVQDKKDKKDNDEGKGDKHKKDHARKSDDKKPSQEKKPDKKPEPEKKPAVAKKTAEPDKKPNPDKKPEPAKKPEVAKKTEPAKKPEPGKSASAAAAVTGAAPAAGSAVALVTYEKGKGANLIGRDEALEKVRAALKQNPTAKFVVTGHADDSPHAATNQDISENRANFLAAHLRTNGIPKDRVESRGVGNTQATKGQPNRRVVIEMKK